MNKKPIPVYGDGMQVRDWIYVVDHCKAIDTILHSGIPGETYNIGARNERTNIETIKFILNKTAEKLNISEKELTGLITFVKDRSGHDRRYAIDPSKIEQKPGWKPEINFEEGITRTIEWYISNKTWWQRIISGEYKQYYEAQYGERLKT